MASGADLVAAIKANDIARAKEVLRANPAAASARDENGVSAILNARYRGQTELIELIGASGVALDLFEAATLGQAARVQELLDIEPLQVNTRSADGFTALHLACFFGQEDIARVLLERGAEPAMVAKNAMRVQPLHSAAAGRQVGIVRMLLERGAPVDARQHGGWTALHEAANSGNRDMTELLLRYGADPSAINEQGRTAVDIAAQRGHNEVVQLLERSTQFRAAG